LLLLLSLLLLTIPTTGTTASIATTAGAAAAGAGSLSLAELRHQHGGWLNAFACEALQWLELAPGPTEAHLAQLYSKADYLQMQLDAEPDAQVDVQELKADLLQLHSRAVNFKSMKTQSFSADQGVPGTLM
jgi:LPXTG cell wall anchor motif